MLDVINGLKFEIEAIGLKQWNRWCDMMTNELQIAVTSLNKRMKRYSWFIIVGVGLVDGSAGLFIYTRRLNNRIRKYIPDMWEGFPVVCYKMSQLQMNIIS